MNGKKLLKFEDYIWVIGPKYEYVNPEHIKRIRVTRKRIKMYTGTYTYIYVAKSKYNIEELKKIGVDINDE